MARYYALTNAYVYGTDYTSIIIKDNIIEDVGGDNLVSKYRKILDKIIDVDGRVVIPGLIDSHLHLLGTILFKKSVNLRNCRSIEEIKLKIKRYARKVSKRKWIIGRGWDQNLFKEKRFPTRWDLDEVTPDNPVLITRVCGHVGVVNSLALKLAGISKNTPNPPNGIIDRDECGEPTGLLYEGALDMVRKIIPLPTTEEVKHELHRLLVDMASYGLTTVHSISVCERELKALMELAKEGKLPIRVRIYLSEEEFVKLFDTIARNINDFLKIMGIKLFADGSLGGRTAALREPYTDAPSTTGVLTITQSKLRYWLHKGVEQGFQVAVHAIGDKAIEFALKTSLELGVSAPTLRIEHASVTPPDIIELLSKVKPLITIQPHFLVTDWWLKSRLGDRVKYVYRFKSLIEKGLYVSGSSDSPVEPYNPWLSISASMTRANFSCISSGEALSLDQALTIYTTGSARASWEHHILGQLKPGYYADLVVLEHDITSMSGYDVSATRVYMTIVNGRIVYKGRIC